MCWFHFPASSSRSVPAAGLSAPHTTVRRALHALGYRWKRPRFVLSRRAEHWRQAKVGSKPG